MALPDPTFEETAAHGRRAQLLLALLLLSLFPIFLLNIPVQTHSVRIDLPALPEAARPDLRPAPAYILTIPVLRSYEVEPPRPLHRLVVTPRDEVLFNGRKLTLASLRERLDSISARESEWIDFRPDANARYEFFAEILAVAKRARIERLLIDNRPFRTSMDDRPEPFEAGG